MVENNLLKDDDVMQQESNNPDADALSAEDMEGLSQEEIDSLLGFDEDTAKENNTGIKAIINKAATAYERLPMLEIVFDRFVRVTSTSLRNFTSDNVDVSIDSIMSMRFGDYLNSIPLPALLMIFKVEEWENYGIMVMDGALVYSFIEVLLGGRKMQNSVKGEGREYTSIEQDLIKKISEIMFRDMTTAFAPLCKATFRSDRLETNPRFATIARPENGAIAIKLSVDMDGRGGGLDILFPYGTLEPVREMLLQVFFGEKLEDDFSWNRYLEQEVGLADVTLDAMLEERTMRFGDIAKMQVGEVLVMDTHPDSLITLKCGEIPMCVGNIGQVDGKVAIKVNKIIHEPPRKKK